MKKYFWIFTLIISIAFGQKVSAEDGCSLKAEKDTLTNKILFTISTATCPNVPLAAPKGYKLVISDKKFFSEIPKNQRYPTVSYHYNRSDNKEGAKVYLEYDKKENVVYTYLVGDAAPILNVTNQTYYDTVQAPSSLYVGKLGKSVPVNFLYASLLRYDDTSASNLELYYSTDTAESPIINVPISVTTISPKATFKPLRISGKDSNGNVIISGGSDSLRGYRVEISQTPLPAGKADFDGTPIPIDIPASAVDQVARTFSYTAAYSSLFPNPAGPYYVRQVALYGGKITDKDSNVVSPNATYGSNIVAQATDTDKHSYKLLADERITVWDINSQKCINDRSLPEKDQDKSLNCSFSDILNYVIKIAIGLAVVALVLRIMYQGFIYMTTDSIGMKSSVKTSIMDMAVGLIIALTSWVILNTINPTLVNNTLSVDSVTISRMSIEESQQRIATMLSGKIPAPGAGTLKAGETKKIQVTCYITAREDDFSGTQTSDIKDTAGALIARVKLGFFDKDKPLSPLFVEGAGLLADGRIVTVNNNSRTDPRYKVTAAPMGAYGTLSPMRSIAVDPSLIAPGSEVEIPYFKDKTVNYVDKDGSIKTFKQDGKFIATDTGGALKGNPHIDVYAGFGNRTMSVSGCNSFAGGTTSGQKYLDIKIVRQGK